MSKHVISKQVKKPLSAAVGAAFMASVALAPGAFAADNPFELRALSSGYEVAEKGAEGKCGEGKCGADGKAKAEGEGKCGEGKCGAEGKAAKAEGEGKCGEGKCGAEGKAAKAEGEGKCGEGKCGAGKSE